LTLAPKRSATRGSLIHRTLDTLDKISVRRQMVRRQNSKPVVHEASLTCRMRSNLKLPFGVVSAVFVTVTPFWLKKAFVAGMREFYKNFGLRKVGYFLGLTSLASRSAHY